MKIAIFILVLLYPFGVYALHTDHDGKGPQKHYEGSLFKVTDKGLFSVEMVIKGKELKTGVNTLDIIVHDKDNKDVVGAEITITPWMPSMGHGVFEKPVVTERGGGLYSVGNIILIMSGQWDLRVQVKKNGLTDNVTFNFPDVKSSETLPPNEHKMMYSSAPADVDTATDHTSAKKLFRVSYMSESVPIPIGKIISWKLRVETADGRPAENAEISINGGMPEHGHGLPTHPEITKGIGDGDYIVQGLKFSMPGWWVITFKVKAQDMEDTVTFNLMVQ
jgi:hypothetical protein